MATDSLHWKWQSLTLCQRHPGEPIKNIFGMFDNVIDLNYVVKFGFGKIFWAEGTYNLPKDSSFLCTLMRMQLKRLNRF